MKRSKNEMAEPKGPAILYWKKDKIKDARSGFGPA
ncbi:hypothetical protein H4W29_000314 [Rhizobium viscosum]|uniref:Uncharacterized protein n=1 Tax=Rhizobium viscosum TaxID=1673 RepID=A0ABR9IIZ2_RHIVS|nr:hypothetical protein [Rhizobium viscosum]